MNRSFQPPDRAAPEMEQISIPLRSMDICSISESGFLSFFGFWVENVSRDIDNIIIKERAAFIIFLLCYNKHHLNHGEEIGVKDLRLWFFTPRDSRD